MAVLHAVATAGGLESILKSNFSMVIEGTREQARFFSEVEHLKRSLAEYARLTAERDGIERAVAPTHLVELAGQGGAADLMTRENESSSSRRRRSSSRLPRSRSFRLLPGRRSLPTSSNSSSSPRRKRSSRPSWTATKG